MSFVKILNLNADCFYFLNPNTIYSETVWELDYDKVKALEKHKLVIANFSAENFGPGCIENTYRDLKQTNLNFILLCHSPVDHQAHPEIYFFPHWYQYTVDNMSRWKSSILQKADNVEKNIKVSCLNGSPKPHRILNYCLLQRKPYVDSIFFSMHSGGNRGNDDDILSPDIKQQWESILPTLQDRSTIKAFSGYIAPYYDSYISLVTESTTIPEIFVTEKTWHPIAFGQLFLVVGGKGIIKHLRELGVDTFDDIIDHAYYDNEDDVSTRILKCHTVLESLLSQDLYELNKATQARRISNITKFFNGEFGAVYVAQINEVLNNVRQDT